MSYSTMNQGGQQDGGYGGGKSGPMNQITNGLGDTIQNQMTSAGQQSTTDFGRTALPAIGQAGGNFARGLIPDNNYQGGPPKLDLSGMMPQTPAQKVAESQAGGGILKLRQPQPFNPNPTPNPGFGGGKGLIQPIGGGGGYGGGKGMIQPMDMLQNMQNTQNQVPTKTYGQY